VLNKLTNGVTCFSHAKDVDGLSSASIVRMATGASVVLVDYNNIVDKLDSLSEAKEVYICDIGLNRTLAIPFLNEIKRITGFASVHFIDHHPLDEKLSKQLIGLGVDLYHSLEESCSVLAYTKLSGHLKDGAHILASYGAVTDYMDDGPSAKKLISRFDRQFILLESTLLTYALLGSGDDLSFRSNIVEELSELKFPHEIHDILKYSHQGLKKISSLMIEVAEKGIKRNWIAIMEAKEASAGILANLLIGAFDTPIGVSYRLLKDQDLCEVSIRGSYDSKFNLGKIVTQITEMTGGIGGGHKKAAGARIPSKSLNEFLDMIEFKLDMAFAPSRKGSARFC